jgi:hypothetical protein
MNEIEKAIVFLQDIKRVVDNSKRDFSCTVNIPFERAFNLDTALAALREQAEREKGNTPLSLDELRGMDGEPVYCMGFTKRFLDGWGIVNIRKKLINDGHSDYWDFSEYGKEYTAYRRKPKEEA